MYDIAQEEADRAGVPTTPLRDDQYHQLTRQQQIDYRRALDQQIAQIQEERRKQQVYLSFFINFILTHDVYVAECILD